MFSIEFDGTTNEDMEASGCIAGIWFAADQTFLRGEVAAYKIQSFVVSSF